MLFQFLLFCLYLTKFVNNLIICQQKVRLQNLNQIFPVISPTFYFAQYVRTSLKVASLTFGLVFMKLKNVDLQVFSLFNLSPILSYSFPILPIQQLFSKYYSQFSIDVIGWEFGKGMLESVK